MLNNFHLKCWLPACVGITLLLFSAACQQNKSTSALTTITIKQQANIDTLYLDGTIQPINMISVIAPFDGVITQQYFDYGALIKKSQLLLTIHSSQFNDNYQEALANYLKAKKDYANNLSKMSGTEELKRLGIISRDEYLNDQSQVYDSALSLAQAKRKLQELLAKTNHYLDLSQLSATDSQAIAHIIQQPAELLRIYSPNDGIALLPAKSANNSDDNNRPLQVGDQIKTGQVLLTVGNISGIILTVKVNEIHINDIRVGQQAIITSDAFKDTLQGKVTHVDQQATQDNSDNLPSFILKISVPTLTDAQRKMIHIGMSAKVALQITRPAAITVPLNAVITKNSQTFVKRLNKTTHNITEVPVITGATSLDAVVIQQGLKPGDEVVINADH